MRHSRAMGGGGEYWVNKVGPFGVASTAYTYDCLAALNHRLVLATLLRADVWGLLYSDDTAYAIAVQIFDTISPVIFVLRSALGDPLAARKIQAGTIVTWIGFRLNYTSGAAHPKEDKRQTALTSIEDALDTETRTKKAQIVSLRGLLSWMAHVHEAYRPFLASLFQLGAADPARAHLLAWKTCPAEVTADLLIWQALFRRDAEQAFLYMPVLCPDATIVTDACAGPCAGPGCAWPSGCGVGGIGPNN